MASSPLIPPDEAARLRTLQQYDVLHSLNEAVFDEFVALAARIFSLPISLIAVVDEEQVHYAANFGMPGNDVQSREEALCSTAILHDKAVVYKDLSTEQEALITAQAMQAAEQNQLRFYAAAPLRMPDQRSVGTLCIIDRQPRVFTMQEQHVLEELAALVSEAVVTRHCCRNLPAGGEARWQSICAQLQEELQGLTALVRYLLTRYGIQAPVPTDVLAQVERRFQDLHDILSPQ